MGKVSPSVTLLRSSARPLAFPQIASHQELWRTAPTGMESPSYGMHALLDVACVIARVPGRSRRLQL
jgi:hypothetical protein